MAKVIKIRMLVCIGSADWSFAPNQILVVSKDIDEKTAQAWCNAGHAEKVVE